MPNTQTSVPAFTAGQVLTAAQMTEVNTGIPVFATTTTRDAAFGGTGEKVLAEGQFAYLEDTNTTQYYDGAAWQTVGVTPGLVLIKSQTIGSAVSSVAVTNAFSATYENYRITLSGGSASANGHIQMILGSTTAGYYWAGAQSTFGGGGVGIGTLTNTSYMEAAYGSTNGLSTVLDVFSPFASAVTQFNLLRTRMDTGGASAQLGGILNNTTSYTGFTLTPASGTLTGGTIRVYGYQNS